MGAARRRLKWVWPLAGLFWAAVGGLILLFGGNTGFGFIILLFGVVFFVVMVVGIALDSLGAWGDRDPNRGHF